MTPMIRAMPWIVLGIATIGPVVLSKCLDDKYYIMDTNRWRVVIENLGYVDVTLQRNRLIHWDAKLHATVSRQAQLLSLEEAQRVIDVLDEKL